MIPGDTIVAPTTPYGHSGVANIRISGSGALKILSKLSGGQVFSNRCATLSSLRGFDKKFIEHARSVYKLNDERAKVKRQVNESFGSNIKEIKKYTEY